LVVGRTFIRRGLHGAKVAEKQAGREHHAAAGNSETG